MNTPQTPFPSPPQIASQYCFLSPLEEQQRLRIELNYSVLLCPMANTPRTSTMQLTHLMTGRYGGSLENWEVKPVRLGYLVKLADWVSQDQLYHDDVFWAERGFTMNTWWALNSSNLLPPPVEVVISITDFPADFQHPYYYRQATSAMGVLTRVLRAGRHDSTGSQVRLGLTCYTAALIPSSLYVGHNGRWTKCSISVERDHLQGEAENGPPPPPPDPYRMEQGNQTGGEDGNPAGPYIPPWRRRCIRTQPQHLTPEQRATQVTIREDLGTGSTEMEHEPDQTVPGPQTPPASNHTPTVPWVSSPPKENKEVSVHTAAHDHAFSASGQTTLTSPSRRTCGADSSWKASEGTCHHVIRDMLEYKLACKQSNTVVMDACHPAGVAQPNQKSISQKEYPPKPNNGPNKCSQPYATHVPPNIDIYPCTTIFNQTPFNTTYTQPQPISLALPPIKILAMTELNEEEQALIQKFIGLQTEESLAPTVTLSQEVTTNTNWEACLLARIVTERTTLEAPFIKAMMQAWDAHPATTFRPVARNCYLIEFHSEKDRLMARRGTWTYRGDLVALQQVHSQSDVHMGHISHAPLYVQLFNLPVNCIKNEGVDIIARKLGQPLSPPAEGFVGGKRFIKIKVLINITEPLKDRVKVTHPTLGELKVYCVYEKVTRVCAFCGGLGHEFATCADHERLVELVHRMPNADGVFTAKLLEPKRGAWMTNASLIPLVTDADHEGQVNNKRRYVSPNGQGFEQGPTRPLPITGPSSSSPSSQHTIGMDADQKTPIKRQKPAGLSPATNL